MDFFLLEEALFQIMDLYFGQKQRSKVKNTFIMILFLTNMQLFTSQEVNLLDEWCGLL